MRILLVLTCCFGLALFAGAAQEQQNNSSPAPKKKGGGNAPSQQAVAPQARPQRLAFPPERFHKAGPGGPNAQQPATGKSAKKWQGPVTGGNPTNVSGKTNVSAKNTTFNK